MKGVKKRNRSRPAESFEVRLRKFADVARSNAHDIRQGGERDLWLRKAEQTDNALALVETLSGRNIRK